VKLYTLCSIYIIASIFWWCLYRKAKSVFVLSTPFAFFGLSFLLLGFAITSKNPFTIGWIYNVATGLYTFGSAAGCFYFALNFGSEGMSCHHECRTSDTNEVRWNTPATMGTSCLCHFWHATTSYRVSLVLGRQFGRWQNQVCSQCSIVRHTYCDHYSPCSPDVGNWVSSLSWLAKFLSARIEAHSFLL